MANLVNRIAAVFAGRWQIPGALVAAAAAGVVLSRLAPPPVPFNLDAALAVVAELEQAGDRQRAAAALSELLSLQPPVPAEARGRLHDRLAALIYASERLVQRHSPENAARILEHDKAAREAGMPESSAAQLRRAFALAWSGQSDHAAKLFRELLASGLAPGDQRAVVREMAAILERRPWAREERNELLTQVLDQPGAAPACLWWGLQQTIQDAVDAGDPERARALLAEHGERLQRSSLRGYREYLNALVLVAEMRLDEAIAGVDWVDEWLLQSGGTNPEMDEFGKLSNLNRWLRGRVELARGRAEEALESFTAAQLERPLPALRLAAGLGQAEALAALGRHAEARRVLSALLAELGPIVAEDGGLRRSITESLLGLFDARRAGEDVENAAAYLAICWRARHLALGDRAGEATGERHDEEHALPWTTVKRAARVLLDDDDRRTWLLWEAARRYAAGRRWAAARAALRTLLDGHVDDPHRPEALLLLGQAARECGQPREAIEYFTQLVDLYPALEPAGRARVERARVLMTLGAAEAGQAERQLADLLMNGAIAPDAAVYHDALLTLCDLLESQGRYAEAIGRWQDFLELYPADPQVLRVRFSIADAYRRSAEALRAPSAAGHQGADALAESSARFRRAAELFGALGEELRRTAQEGMESGGPAEPEGRAWRTSNGQARDRRRARELDLMRRLVHFYRAKCLLEQADPQARRESLATYRLAAAEYDGQPAALTAQVQIADVLLQEGDVAGAARALERARWLLKSLPMDSFADRGAGDRGDWERYLSKLLSAPLFQEAYTLAES